MKKPSLHPKTWIILGLSGAILSLAPLTIPSKTLLLAGLTTLILYSGTHRPWAKLTLTTLLPIATIAFTIQATSHPGNTIYASWTPLNPITFTLTAQGLHYGSNLALQILTFGTSCALITLPTGPHQLRHALTAWKTPPRLTYLLITTINAPTQLQHYATIAQETAAARGLPQPGLHHRILHPLRLTATLLTLILTENPHRTRTITHHALDQAGPRTLLNPPTDTTPQTITRWTTLTLALLTTITTYL